jgi:hypothetical protein
MLCWFAWWLVRDRDWLIVGARDRKVRYEIFDQLHSLTELEMAFLLILNLKLNLGWQVIPTTIRVFLLQFGLSSKLGEVCLDPPVSQWFFPSEWLLKLVCVRSPIINSLSNQSSVQLRDSFRVEFHVKFENKNYWINQCFQRQKAIIERGVFPRGTRRKSNSSPVHRLRTSPAEHIAS